jgi:hypothetical protein
MSKYIDLLTKFVDARPGLCFADYGDRKIYFREMREITNDRGDFYELLRLAYRLTGDSEKLSETIKNHLEKSSDRLTLSGEKLQYITGQYYPTEYRPAACRVLSRIVWVELMNERKADGSPVYETGTQIRSAIKRAGISHRAFRNYFN